MSEVKKLVETINQQSEQKILLENVYPNDYNKNKMDGHRWELLLKSLKTFKQVYPVIVRKDNEGKFVIIDGEHRWKGLRELKETEIICKVVNFSEAEARLFTIHINKMRGKTSEVGERQVIEPIRDQLQYLDVSSLTMLPPLSTPASIGEIPSSLPDAPKMDLSTGVSLVPQLKDDKADLPEAIGSSYEKSVAVEQNTVAIPLFFTQKDYEYVMSMTMKVKEKYKLPSREEAFIMVAKIGEESEQHREENKRLKEKFEKLEVERQEKAKAREEKKQQSIKKQLKKDEEKARKKAEKKGTKNVKSKKEKVKKLRLSKVD